MPVVHYERKMVFRFDLLCNRGPFCKSIAHNSNQHVQKMEKHDEDCKDKQNT